GDLYTSWQDFIQFTLQREPEGVDLVMADGGFELESAYHRQEFLSSRLLLIQAIIGIACTREGGNFLLKVFDTVTLLSAQIIYALATAFKRITIFKPVSSRPANAERYLIGQDRKSSIQVAHILTLL